MIGKTVGHFEILDELGRGGMGTVYKALDGRLNRIVALKLLPPESVHDPDRHRRFLQEARSASALNHPNIVHIYEVGDDGDMPFIAMEHVSGSTLTTLIPEGGMQVRDLLRYSAQITSALTAAHARGIIHRDLKPSNVMITDQGEVKLLDFGLAKVVDVTRAEGDITRTIAADLTAQGTVVGTAAYMSPEQAEGKPIDARSDIFSFGAMLYEMITGKRAFTGDSHLATLSALLRDDPKPIERTDVPPELESIVRRCLRKQPDGRFPNASELNNAVQELKTETQSSVSRVSALPASKSFNWRIPVLLLATVIVAALALWRLNQTSSHGPKAANLQAEALTTAPGLAFGSSLSPDGREIAFSSNRSGKFEIYVRAAAPGGGERQLTNDGQQNIEPAWSPNGKLIAFHSAARHGIWAIPAAGGLPLRQLSPFGSRPVWSPDDTGLAFRSSEPADLAWFDLEGTGESVIFTVGYDGSDLRQLTTAGNPDGRHADPSWSADSKRVVFVSLGQMGARASLNTLWTVDVASGKTTQIDIGQMRGISSPIFSADSQTLYFSALATDGFGIFALPLKGKPEPVPIYQSGREAPASLQLSSDNKRLFFSKLVNVSQIWQTASDDGEPTALYQDEVVRAKLPAYSPDGKRLAYVVQGQNARQDLWVVNADGSNPTVLVSEPGYANGPGWTPDGQFILYAMLRSPMLQMRRVLASGGASTVLFEGPSTISRVRITPDGQDLIYDSSKPMNVWSRPLHEGQPRQLTFEREGAGFPRISPNGEWIVYSITHGQGTLVAVMDRNGGQKKIVFSEPGVHYPYSIADDNRRIAFASFRDGVWNIFWVDRITTEVHQVTNYTAYGSVVRSPEWRPGTHQIAYEFTQVKGNIAFLNISQ